MYALEYRAEGKIYHPDYDEKLHTLINYSYSNGDKDSGTDDLLTVELVQVEIDGEWVDYPTHNEDEAWKICADDYKEIR